MHSRTHNHLVLFFPPLLSLQAPREREKVASLKISKYLQFCASDEKALTGLDLPAEGLGIVEDPEALMTCPMAV